MFLMIWAVLAKFCLGSCELAVGWARLWLWNITEHSHPNPDITKGGPNDLFEKLLGGEFNMETSSALTLTKSVATVHAKITVMATASLDYSLDLPLPLLGVPPQPLLPPRRHLLVLALVLCDQIVQCLGLALGLDHGRLASVGVA